MAKSHKVLIIFVTFCAAIILFCESAPTPSPGSFPFTVVPPKGSSHRRFAGKRPRLDYMSYLMYKSLLIDKAHRYVQSQESYG
ncbi:hypothetical protein PVAND_012306 [Polypedilum vanderplanki]|uniref:Uncharacterized protein n=1 Tax=Polypedilum vanderplanki TaxID=319348 RepID=A0A9J6CL63_POLVA|nr:hypothetical protein PVAND_012306 [Polypedilum vanderplanki]